MTPRKVAVASRVQILFCVDASIGMTVSLTKLLQSSRLDPLRPGMRPEEVMTLLGEPDTTGGTSRKYPQSAIFVYGTLEFYFSKEWPRALTGIFWEPGSTGDLRVPEGWIVEDWHLQAGMPQASVVDYLNAHGLPYRDLSPSEALLLESGVRISFEGQTISGLFAPQCEPMPSTRAIP